MLHIETLQPFPHMWFLSHLSYIEFVFWVFFFPPWWRTLHLYPLKYNLLKSPFCQTEKKIYLALDLFTEDITYFFQICVTHKFDNCTFIRVLSEIGEYQWSSQGQALQPPEHPFQVNNHLLVSSMMQVIQPLEVHQTWPTARYTKLMTVLYVSHLLTRSLKR